MTPQVGALERLSLETPGSEATCGYRAAHSQDIQLFAFSTSPQGASSSEQRSAGSHASKHAAGESPGLLGNSAILLSPSRTLNDSPPRSLSRDPLAYLRDSCVEHLPDSIDLSLPDDGALIVSERMGLGCVQLSREQAVELVERELAVRCAGPSVVPEWVWDDEGEGDEEESGLALLDDAAGVREEAQQHAAFDSAPSRDHGGSNTLAAAADRLQSARSAGDVRSPMPSGSKASTPPLPGGWHRVWDGYSTGTLFAPDDLSGVMEP